MVMASYLHSASHLLKPVQATSQAFFAAPPLSWLMQETNIRLFLLPLGRSSMISRGHAVTHALQAVHLSSMTTGRPVLSSIYMASKSQASTHSPNPRHPY